MVTSHHSGLLNAVPGRPGKSVRAHLMLANDAAGKVSVSSLCVSRMLSLDATVLRAGRPADSGLSGNI